MKGLLFGRRKDFQDLSEVWLVWEARRRRYWVFRPRLSGVEPELSMRKVRGYLLLERGVLEVVKEQNWVRFSPSILHLSEV